MRLNIGCGMTPTPGWRNLDNSPAVKLAHQPIRRWLLRITGFLNRDQLSYIDYCQKNSIEYADGLKLPFPDSTVEVVYSSHTLEHMSRESAKHFLMEAMRVLTPGGVLRISVPNLHYYCQKYLNDGDVNSFLHNLHMIGPILKTFRSRLRAALIGPRHHQWMYDGPHLTALFQDAGFHDIHIMPTGATLISNPGPLNLQERSPESLYVEARKS